MRKKYRSKDIFEEETKQTNFLFPIIVFIIVVLVLSVITTIVFSLLEKHTNIDIPWNDNFKEENKKKPSSSRDQMDLIAPSIETSNKPTKELNSNIGITKVIADDDGFLIAFELKTLKGEFTTVEVKQVIIDGFYFTTQFAVSDRLDYNELNYPKIEKDQEATTIYFRIKKTELDAIGMFGFNNIKLIYDIENNIASEKDKELYVTFNNDLNIVNERTGLIRMDEKNNVILSYFKTVSASDATYIYFDFQNNNRDKDIEVYVKELIINNKTYDMSDFQGLSHRNCRELIYLKVPTKDISMVHTMKIRFFLVETNSKGEKSFYITDEYSRAY